MAKTKTAYKPAQTGHFNDTPRCPICGADTKPMTGGKGFRCINGKAVKTANGWDTIGCKGTVWNNQWGGKKKEVVRASDFPTIAKETPEQIAIRQWLAKKPGAKRSRFLAVNAGPGTGKTTSLASDCRDLLARCGTLADWIFLAFNTNASEVLQTKLPACASVATLNSHFGKAQGYQYKNYDSKKLWAIWQEVTKGIERQERPRFGGITAIIERMRDILQWAPEAGSPEWRELIQTTIARFPGLSRGYVKNAADIDEFLPQVMHSASVNGATIDIGEQYTRPAFDAMRRIGWTLPDELVSRDAVWTGEHIAHFAKLVKAIKLPETNLIVDEAQDMSLPLFAAVLAQTWRSKELVIIGDDKHGAPGDNDYQAGQGIYGWRGAGGGMFALAVRLWQELTGEEADEKALSVSFRCSPRIVASFQDYNKVLTSGREEPADKSGTYVVGQEAAFAAFLACKKEALWITRRNAPLAPLLLRAIKERKQVAIRGSGQLMGAVDRVLSGVSKGKPEAYSTPLREAMDKLAEDIDAQKEGGVEQADSVEEFVLYIGRMLLAEPDILKEAELGAVATTNALRAFIAFYNDRQAPRVLSTVYRCKGDEAHLVVMDSGDKADFATAWNDDSAEMRACAHVAASRAKNWLLLTAPVPGIVPTGEIDGECLELTLRDE